MKRYRSALMAGLLALAVAVCDDDGTVVQPPPTVNVSPPQVTVTVPPAPPVVAPLQAMITPPSAEVGVDGMVDFAIGTSGGSGTASWTCTSSDAAVATVETTDTGCRATAVAGGGVTVTAAVTKGSESTNVAAQLTVSTTTDAFILVTNISGEGGSGATGLKGNVEVEVSVERGSQTFEKLSLNVDGMEVDFQDFGTAAADDAEQTAHEFTLSFNSAAYEEHGDHIDVAYMNGDHSIQALLKIAGRDDALMSNVLDVVFANDDGYMVDAHLGDYSMLDDAGRRWYGGPANGHIVISALPVSYSGAETGVVTIDLAGCTAGEYEGDDHGNGDDHGHGGGGAAFEFDCTGEMPGRAITVSEGGTAVAMAKILNYADLPVANIDMKGPATAPYFHPNPNNRELGWVNATVDFGGEQKSDNEDGWLTYNAADPAPGVGGYMPVLRYAEGTDIEDAIAAAPLSRMNFPGESDINAYCVVVSAIDALGNESELPDEDTGTCAIAGTAAVITANGTVTTAATANSYEALLQDLVVAQRTVPLNQTNVDNAKAALADAGLRAGLDITAPGIEIDVAMRINDIASLTTGLLFDIYDDLHDDHNSGLHSMAPLLTRIQRRTTDDTECLAIDDAASALATPPGTPGEVQDNVDVSCTADPSALGRGTAVTFTSGASHAYYTLTGSAVDRAGNFATPVSHTFVFDANAVATNATATAPAAPGSLEPGESFQIASFLNDDLSIREYYVTADFPAVGSITPIRLGVVAPTPVDAFNAAMLTHRNFSVTADVDTYAGLQEVSGSPAAPVAGVGELSTVTVAVRDQADMDGTDDGTPSSALSVAQADADAFAINTFTVAFTSSEPRLCAAEDLDDCDDMVAATDDDETETELEVVATQVVNTPPLSEPFDRVDFWVRDVNGASWMLGSDTSGERDFTGTGTNRVRTWTYSLDATVMDLYMRTREAAFPPGSDMDDHEVLAFAVNDDGVALVMEVTIDIDDGEANQ